MNDDVLAINSSEEVLPSLKIFIYRLTVKMPARCQNRRFCFGIISCQRVFAVGFVIADLDDAEI